MIDIAPTALSGVVRVTLPRFADVRGFLLEAFNAEAFRAAGVPTDFVQDNQSRSRRGVLRGLHFQWNPPLGKLIRVGHGRVYLVLVDIRKSSPTFTKWLGETVSDESELAWWVPPGIATGFCALADDTDIHYKYSAYYNPSGEGCIRWDDPDLAIAWPIADPALSERDRDGYTLAQWLARPESDAWPHEQI